jgi:hypothetical protein
MKSIPLIQNPFCQPVSLQAGLSVRFSRLATEHFRQLFRQADDVSAVHIDQVALHRVQECSRSYAGADTIGEADVVFVLRDGRRHSEACTIEAKGFHDLVLTTDSEATWNQS